MEFDLNILNIKPKIIVDTKVTFPKEILKKAGILSMDEVEVKGEITSDIGEYFLNISLLSY